MTDKELLDTLKKSADTVEVPHSLSPEQIVLKLHTPAKRHFLSPQKILSAAALFLCCGILSFYIYNNRIVKDSSVSEETSYEDNSYITAATESLLKPPSLAKQNADNLYTIAHNYEEVYETIQNSVICSYETGNELATAEVRDFTQEISMKEDAAAEYSSTNLQTEGIDEGDRIKTDGRYIYTLAHNQIHIINSENGILSEVGLIRPNLDASDSILEFYVDNDRLVLLTQHHETSLVHSGIQSKYTDDNSYSYSMEAKSQTILSVYDISAPENPILEGTTIQDGVYHTSRKIEDMIYLFTDQYFSNDEKAETLIPCINHERIPYENIYLSDEGSQALVLSSIHLQQPEEIVDKIMIVHNSVNIYVGNNSIYLYRTDYSAEEILTEIAGFSMNNGILNATHAASVKGEILDTFAINESNRQLRVLTTSYNEAKEESNNLYLFDSNMALTGSLTEIAMGERIYAARYIGDIVYFITYKNTDPLFAADISDSYHPKLLGELKISGFSEYLHFWGDDKLLGFGYETDPNSGETIGLKLVMFDISNPLDLKVIDSYMLETYLYSPALYDYKSFLADTSANLIGFAGENQNQHSLDTFEQNYLLFSWEDNHFSLKLNAALAAHYNLDYVRGIYIKDIFYIADSNQITSYDRNCGYKEIDHFSINSSLSDTLY